MVGIVIVRGRWLDVVIVMGWISGCGVFVLGNVFLFFFYYDV